MIKIEQTIKKFEETGISRERAIARAKRLTLVRLESAPPSSDIEDKLLSDLEYISSLDGGKN